MFKLLLTTYQQLMLCWKGHGIFFLFYPASLKETAETSGGLVRVPYSLHFPLFAEQAWAGIVSHAFGIYIE